MAQPMRFELMASSFGGTRSIQLSYGCLYEKFDNRSNRLSPTLSRAGQLEENIFQIALIRCDIGNPITGFLNYINDLPSSHVFG